MNALIATEVRIYLYDNNYYSSESFYKIIERYKNNFKNISILTRLIETKKIPNGYKKITGLFKEFYNSKSVVSSILPFNKLFQDLVKKNDLIILRVPSIISYRLYKYIKKYNKVYLTESMGCAWDAYWNHGIIGKLVAPFGFFNMKRVVYNADYATYVTKFFLQNRYPCKSKSIGVSNVNITKVKNIKDYNNFDKNNFTLFTAAAVDVKYKGQQYVFRAMQKLKKQNIDIKYYLAGGGNQTYLRKLAKKYKIENNIIFLGQLSQNELYEIFKKIDIYIQPSLQEGLPRSVIEAMSYGCVCLGSTTAGIPELLQNYCLFKRANSNSIADTITNVINYDLNNISKRNSEIAKNYLEEKLNDKRYNYYDYIANEIKMKVIK